MNVTYAIKTINSREWDSWFSQVGGYCNMGSDGYGANRENRIGFLTVHLSGQGTRIATHEEERQIKRYYVATQYQFPGITEFIAKEQKFLKNKEEEQEKSFIPTEMFNIFDKKE